jgi:hypothetical protein
MTGRIGLPNVGFSLDDDPGRPPAAAIVHEQLADQVLEDGE